MLSLLREAERKWKGHIKGTRKGMERTLKEYGEDMARNEQLEEEGRGNEQANERRETQRSEEGHGQDMERTPGDVNFFTRDTAKLGPFLGHF